MSNWIYLESEKTCKTIAFWVWPTNSRKIHPMKHSIFCSMQTILGKRRNYSWAQYTFRVDIYLTLCILQCTWARNSSEWTYFVRVSILIARESRRCIQTHSKVWGWSQPSQTKGIISACFGWTIWYPTGYPQRRHGVWPWDCDISWPFYFCR